MDYAEGALRKLSGGNPETIFQDGHGSDLSPNHFAYVHSIPVGGHPPYPSNLLQGGIDAASSLRNPTVRMRKQATGQDNPREAISRRRNGPLNLLDLPADVLKEILSQFTYTSDLTCLALTHSALHRLAIPLIYSRFSIVWPNDEGSAESNNVDALTYGLATLVMGEELFDKAPGHQKSADQGYCSHCTCEHCQNAKVRRGTHPIKKVRRGNHFAQYTRSFCIGNGPKENVKDYHIKREAGKMLGTLAALSLARMPNLEIFKWDMPTGIVRDIWMSLSYASTKLETVWVRFHDNGPVGVEPGPLMAGLLTTQNPLLALNTLSQMPPMRPDAGPNVNGVLALQLSYGRIERPSFSILPPLGNLSVLDIDEIAYVDEMSVLIGRSIDHLRELRISVATRLVNPGGWTAPANAAEYFCGIDVTGLLFSKVYDTSLPDEACATTRHQSQFQTLQANNQIGFHGLSYPSKETSSRAAASLSNTDTEGLKLASQIQSSFNGESTSRVVSTSGTAKKLRLQILEIEKLLLNASALQNSIDWSLITTLTLLHCGNHEQLWKALRKAYSPRSSSFSTLSVSPVFRREFAQLSSEEAVEILSQSNLHAFLPNSRQESFSTYKLNLKRLHTDTVSPALISFLKDTLAPNSLEWMFLQDGRDYFSTVKLEAIFQGPIRRHRGSLTKVMIDSAIGPAGKSSNQKRKKWMANTDFLAFVTSGKMASLKELAISLDYKDWHFFLRRLPRVAHLRSLYFPYIAHHSYSKHLKIGDLTSQIVDLIAIRPEIQLSYLGLEDSCFQLIENMHSTQSRRATVFDSETMDIDDNSDFNESESEENDDEDMTDDDVPGPLPSDDPTEAYSGDGEDGAEDSEEDLSELEREEPAIKIRQILFYDSMVSVFKARHGDIRQ